MKDASSWVAIGTALTSACTGLYAAQGIDLRKNVERLFPFIREQAPWAAIAAAVSVVAQATEKLPG